MYILISWLAISFFQQIYYSIWISYFWINSNCVWPLQNHLEKVQTLSFSQIAKKHTLTSCLHKINISNIHNTTSSRFVQHFMSNLKGWYKKYLTTLNFFPQYICFFASTPTAYMCDVVILFFDISCKCMYKKNVRSRFFSDTL